MLRMKYMLTFLSQGFRETLHAFKVGSLVAILSCAVVFVLLVNTKRLLFGDLKKVPSDSI